MRGSMDIRTQKPPERPTRYFQGHRILVWGKRAGAWGREALVFPREFMSY